MTEPTKLEHKQTHNDCHGEHHRCNNPPGAVIGMMITSTSFVGAVIELMLEPTNFVGAVIGRMTEPTSFVDSVTVTEPTSFVRAIIWADD